MMAAAESRLEMDPQDPAYRASLVAALESGVKPAAVALCGLDAGWQLLAQPGQEVEQSAEGAWLGLAERCFGTADHDGDAGMLDAVTLVCQTTPFREAENLLVRRCPDDQQQLLVISVSSTFSASSAQALLQRLASQASQTDLGALLSVQGDVLSGALLELSAPAFTASYRRPDETSQVQLNSELAQALAAMMSGSAATGGEGSLTERLGKSMGRIAALELEAGGSLRAVTRIPMAPGYVLGIACSALVDRHGLRRLQRDLVNDLLRRGIGQLLEGGLQTQIAPFPQTDLEFQRIVSELRALDEEDLLGRLDIGGFAAQGFGEGVDRQQCKECIYYLPNRKWCDLPELPLPVEAHWWCRLWKL